MDPKHQTPPGQAEEEVGVALRVTIEHGFIAYPATDYIDAGAQAASVQVERTDDDLGVCHSLLRRWCTHRDDEP